MSDSTWQDEFLAWIRATLGPGMRIYLRRQLNISGGWYTVVSSDGRMIKLRPRKGDSVQITVEQCLRAIDVPANIEFAPEIGVLGFLGYKVGQDGLTVAERHQILEIVYQRPLSALPKVGNWSEWGEAASTERRDKILRCLSSFAGNAAFGPNPPAQAIKDWDTDVAWFQGRFPRE